MALFRRSKNTNKPVIAQILNLIPPHLLKTEIHRYKSDKGCHKYKTYDQLVALMFGQLNKCYTLSDVSWDYQLVAPFFPMLDYIKALPNLQ